ncbi:hypothetical protein I7I48_09502 [Histoplasma ohiense]|nr:hypothetical protein I7I48_09502 [Histoplasma ohiense (nom. inval.)]
MLRKFSFFSYFAPTFSSLLLFIILRFLRKYRARQQVRSRNILPVLPVLLLDVQTGGACGYWSPRLSLIV